jgi:methanogenic corrinoid protein MtbC1
MKESEVLEALRRAILEMDKDEAIELSREITETNLANEALSVAAEAIREVGDRFQEGELYLPQLVLAGETMQACTALLAPHLEKREVMTPGKVAMATVKGDIHDIGKNIVCMMMSVSGLDVLDLGADVAAMDIVQRAGQYGANIIGLSSLMTTSIPQMREVIDVLAAMGQRDRFFVIVGGGPVTRDHAQTIGADGWAKDAVGAVKICGRLLSSDEVPSEVEFTSGEG